MKESTRGSDINWAARFKKLARKVEDPRFKAYYHSSCVPAGTPVSQVKFLALDIETTGLDREKDDILSIGHIPMAANRIICSAAWHQTIRPEQSPDSPLAEIHGITHSCISKAPDFNNSLSRLLKAMAGHVIVAHHSRIEREFLNRACRQMIGEPLEFPVVDTMELESRVHPPSRPNIFQRWMGSKPGPSLRLSHCRERYGLPRYRPHHALTDALATAELFQAQLAHRYPQGTPVGKLWR